MHEPHDWTEKFALLITLCQKRMCCICLCLMSNCLPTPQPLTRPASLPTSFLVPTDSTCFIKSQAAKTTPKPRNQDQAAKTKQSHPQPQPISHNEEIKNDKNQRSETDVYGCAVMCAGVQMCDDVHEVCPCVHMHKP